VAFGLTCPRTEGPEELRPNEQAREKIEPRQLHESGALSLRWREIKRFLLDL